MRQHPVVVRVSPRVSACPVKPFLVFVYPGRLNIILNGDEPQTDTDKRRLSLRPTGRTKLHALRGKILSHSEAVRVNLRESAVK
jgi:hypothetical protein